VEQIHIASAFFANAYTESSPRVERIQDIIIEVYSIQSRRLIEANNSTSFDETLATSLQLLRRCTQLSYSAFIKNKECDKTIMIQKECDGNEK